MATNYSTMWKSITGKEEPVTTSYEKRGIFPSVFDIPIYLFTNFNEKNYQYMQLHMLRNLQERHITLNSLGENAYANGDSNNFSVPPMQPYYVEDNDYVEFVKKNNIAEGQGQLVTRVNNNTNTLFQTNNKYFDVNNNNKDITFTGDENIDKNSILYKTKKLWNTNKMKSIISAFHTDNTVKYTGQVGSIYGESHGRNLLKYESDPEKGDFTSPVEGEYGYDNPYCRVWTHYHQYDRFCRTMRANSGRLNEWDEDYFDWSDEEVQKYFPEYIGKEKPYAWHGKINQQRIADNTVLDYETGLVNIAPKFLGGGGNNIHTKKCMFSIENLAWKDYDPYSFEQALSWEQRGPMGGRIMWFPPYDLQINETTNANWQPHEFIGRGEKIYTYNNTDRTGNLSFLMLTDHPASVDYAAWFSDSNDLNSDNDYLRYFAGCNDGKPVDKIDGSFVSSNVNNEGVDVEIGSGNSGRNGQKLNNDMLIKRPPVLFDEFEQYSGISIHAPELEQVIPEPVPEQVVVNPVEPQEQTVEFVVYYPNNYSGKYDLPSNPKSTVHSINYLLLGQNAQRLDSKQDKRISKDGLTDEKNEVANLTIPNILSTGNGYEMLASGISDEKVKDNYIIGAVKENTNKYVADVRKKWYYRIDFETDNTGNYKVGKSNEYYINQSLHNTQGVVSYNENPNYIDKNNFQLNLRLNGTTNYMYENTENAYSLAEFACAFYEIQKYELIADYLRQYVDDETKIDRLVELFQKYKLTSINVQGISTSQGYNDANEDLATYRAQSVINWLKEYSEWQDVETISNLLPGKAVSKTDMYNVNGKTSKLNRAAKVKLTFALATTTSVTESKTNDENVNINSETQDENNTQPKKEYKEFVGFTYKETKDTPYGEWDYYIRDSKVKYYEQVGGSSNTSNNDINGEEIVVNEKQINEVMKFVLTLEEYTPCDDRYRGDFSTNGGYINENENELIYYVKDDIVKYEDKYYIFILDCLYEYEFKSDLWKKIGEYLDNEVPFDIDTVYAGDYIFYNNTYYIATEDMIFNSENKWKLVEEIELGKLYNQGDYVLHEGNVYEFIVDGFMNDWENDKVILAEAIQFSFVQPVIEKTLVKNGNYYYVSSVNIDYINKFYQTDIKPIESNFLFEGNKIYDKNDLVIFEGDYYTCNVDCEKYTTDAKRQEYTINNIEWEEYVNDTFIINEYAQHLLNSCANILSVDVNDYLKELFRNKYNFHMETYGDVNIWECGTPDFLNSSFINLEEDKLLSIIKGSIGNLNLTDDEEEYLNCINYIKQELLLYYIRTNYIINVITKVVLDNGDIINTETGEISESVEMLLQKTSYNFNDSNCDLDLWVNIGNGVLVRECEIINLLETPQNLNTGRTDILNKIRYDQEYMFYKKYMCEHPFVFQKLQEKIKYFNPAFHSMTPEGFNARLTFLHQCTRQGNTKTMSDVGGKTANNLAFGRPPFCVLRLGDFYNQLIVIDSISFDYGVSNGLQWDLNTEGNGVQPMLCKVNISFKFIGGGDITGPVRRLQNAMSFNYYANTSFYDNRADRVSYGDTNYQTMGGAGNNQIDYSKSYVYQPKMYSPDNNKHIKI